MLGIAAISRLGLLLLLPVRYLEYHEGHHARLLLCLQVHHHEALLFAMLGQESRIWEGVLTM